ncbi:hypothetical protein KSP35_10155 [Aquihabitans sp. G128]|uniref:hypothetical protein n=1 Tax=Aquihabitans sp. G128 TaxID=2849779 RepID=UPI001C250747|nr:hypothetical protein [Aquihabitans sp. G128]QXC63103.1 hypothetical protein KSP35_10155 [Aquihabitans sp. G128]
MPLPHHPQPHPVVRRGRRAVAAALGLALAATVAVGCSSDSDGAPSAADRSSSVQGMLRLVPDVRANRDYVVVSLYAKATEAAGLRALTSKDLRDEQLERLLKLTNDVETGTGVAPGPIAAGNRVSETYGRLGFKPGDVAAEVTAGRPPSETDVAVGSFRTDRVLDLAADVDGAERRKVDGVEVVSWLDDMRVDTDLDTPIGPLRGQAGRVALPADGVLAYTRADAPMEQVVETVADDHISLAEDDELASLAKSLDRAEVHSAFLSGEPPTGGGRQRPGDADRGAPALEPYIAFATGAALRGGKRQLVVVLLHGTVDAAKANVDRLQAVVDDGDSTVSGQPWKTLLRKPHISRDGRKLVATFEVGNPALWSRIVFSQDTLLATS